jgi:hypothetical protein
VKRILVGLLAIGSISSFASHPKDEDAVKYLGAGTTLTALEDINIKPGVHV